MAAYTMMIRRFNRFTRFLLPFSTRWPHTNGTQGKAGFNRKRASTPFSLT